MICPPNRNLALEKLDAFLPNTASVYKSKRNYDLGPGNHNYVSNLSPAIRHRTIGEWEVVRAVLEKHSLSQSEKFIQEVFWRTYWKGWLQGRPQVWDDYQQDILSLQEELQDSHLYERAQAGETGIDCLDAWVQELLQSGYLHNHARMWFASIWIFTLKLPWQLGAHFFMQHLYDGDPASNTLSWRWVAGLHTRGKTYLARPDNIAKYTQDRFEPNDLAPTAESLQEESHPSSIKIEPLPDRLDSEVCDILVFEDDLCPEVGPLRPHIENPNQKTVLVDLSNLCPYSQSVRSYKKALLEDCQTRLTQLKGQKPEILTNLNQLKDFLQSTPNPKAAYKPQVGYLSEVLDSMPQIAQLRRSWDTELFPHAKAGFFQFKKQIPKICETKFY